MGISRAYGETKDGRASDGKSEGMGKGKLGQEKERAWDTTAWRTGAGGQGCRARGHTYPVESHLVDFFGRVALLLGMQLVAQLLRHLLHHVVPQLHLIHLRPRVLVVLGEFGQIESQALAERMEDPEGVGATGEGRAGEVRAPLPSGAWRREGGGWGSWGRGLGLGMRLELG